jgi:DNA-directed RNA polymerase subunit RPC12/RpoP
MTREEKLRFYHSTAWRKMSAYILKRDHYECQECRYRYVPTYWSTNLAPHMGRTRYMRCPECGKKSWQKKVLTKE